MPSKYRRAKVWFLSKKFWKQIFLIAIAALLFFSGGVLIWVSTLRLPDPTTLKDRVLAGSTKIYDRTGEILLYDVNQNVRQNVVPLSEMSQHIKDATIAIEDDTFYEHSGISIVSIFRAIWVDLKSMSFSQGGSTITQQVVKNTLLSTDKKISRKIKEWVLALKLERTLSKDEILNLYLNSNPYGGTIYGVEEASLGFYGKKSKDLTINEAAYLAAMGKAPSYYSPYGSHRDALETRKNLVLSKMLEKGFITDAEYKQAKAEKLVFKPQENRNIKAPHFVMFVKNYLENKYGEDLVQNGGLKVVTTLDFELENLAEATVKKYALENEVKFKAENAAMVAIDPTTGQILSMVGSRDYFDKKIDGNFNVTTAHRQPGSAFKPFAYVTAFQKGYTPDTVLLDLPTQFSTRCDAYGKPLGSATEEDCYMPVNYDLKNVGPISLRNALATSRNVPAIKLLYLVGIKDTISTAKTMGITSLTTPDRYGLTLVLGGGEVSPLEMTSAYSVFANNGVRNPYTPILKVTDKNGVILEEFKANPTQAIPEQDALLINNVLSDNNARLPLNGPGSATDFPADVEVAIKTGTTNDYRDVWILGYTPNLTVGAWAGNNDNSPMVKKTSGPIITPLWRAFMDEALKRYPSVPFKRPDPIDPNLRPILRGAWQGENGTTEVHDILYWVNKADPKGARPANPYADPQFDLWETPVRNWLGTQGSIPPANLPVYTTPTPTPTTLQEVMPANYDYGTSTTVEQ